MSKELDIILGGFKSGLRYNFRAFIAWYNEIRGKILKSGLEAYAWSIGKHGAGFDK